MRIAGTGRAPLARFERGDKDRALLSCHSSIQSHQAVVDLSLGQIDVDHVVALPLQEFTTFTKQRQFVVPINSIFSESPTCGSQ